MYWVAPWRHRGIPPWVLTDYFAAYSNQVFVPFVLSWPLFLPSECCTALPTCTIGGLAKHACLHAHRAIDHACSAGFSSFIASTLPCGLLLVCSIATGVCCPSRLVPDTRHVDNLHSFFHRRTPCLNTWLPVSIPTSPSPTRPIVTCRAAAAGWRLCVYGGL